MSQSPRYSLFQLLTEDAAMDLTPQAVQALESLPSETPVQVVAIIGTSQCGKSTISNAIAQHLGIAVTLFTEGNGKTSQTTGISALLVHPRNGSPTALLLLDCQGFDSATRANHTIASDVRIANVAALADRVILLTGNSVGARDVQSAVRVASLDVTRRRHLIIVANKTPPNRQNTLTVDQWLCRDGPEERRIRAAFQTIDLRATPMQRPPHAAFRAVVPEIVATLAGVTYRSRSATRTALVSDTTRASEAAAAAAAASQSRVRGLAEDRVRAVATTEQNQHGTLANYAQASDPAAQHDTVLSQQIQRILAAWREFYPNASEVDLPANTLTDLRATARSLRDTEVNNRAEKQRAQDLADAKRRADEAAALVRRNNALENAINMIGSQSPGSCNKNIWNDIRNNVQSHRNHSLDDRMRALVRQMANSHPPKSMPLFTASFLFPAPQSARSCSTGASGVCNDAEWADIRNACGRCGNGDAHSQANILFSSLRHISPGKCNLVEWAAIRTACEAYFNA